MIIFEILVIVLLSSFIIHQIILPSLFGRPIFPMFTKEAELKKELEVAHQIQHEIDLENKIKETLDK